MTTINELLPGQYRNDKRNGKGTRYYTDGSKYTGDWIDDEKASQGVFIWSNGDRYEIGCS
jgi:hypothetical protein